MRSVSLEFAQHAVGNHKSAFRLMLLAGLSLAAKEQILWTWIGFDYRR